MPKILVISHSYHGDGASHVLLEAASYWCKHLGWKVDALLPKGFDGKAIDGIRAAGMHPVIASTDLRAYDFAIVNCIQNIAMTEVLYPHLPVVLWAHEAETMLRSNDHFRSHLKLWFSRASLHIFQTQWQVDVYKDFLGDVPRENIFFIANSVTTYDIKKNPLSGTRFQISNIAKISPLKGQADLIRAVMELSPEHEIACHLIGGLEFLSALPQDVKDILESNRGIFKLHGHLPKRVALEKVVNSDLFCFPSASESFGLAPLEAAAHGVPVVLSNLEVFKHIGWRHGENCLMNTVGDSQSLASQIKKMIYECDMRRDLAHNGMSMALKYKPMNFLSDITNLIINFYKELK